jgi:uncharacterized membrane protein
MGEVKESIDVNVPVSTAYNQWTQFEDFPKFMDNIESVTQLDDTHLRWIAEIRGKRDEWKAEITHQEPDKVIAWRALEGKENSGRVEFEPLEGNRTRIDVTLMWEPEGLVEAAADKIGVSDRATKVDLEHFKELIEGRGAETGAWRGEVVEGERVD